MDLKSIKLLVLPAVLWVLMALPYSANVIAKEQTKNASSYFVMPATTKPILNLNEEVTALSRLHQVVVGVTALTIALMTFFLFFVVASSTKIARKIARMRPIPLLKLRIRSLITYINM